MLAILLIAIIANGYISLRLSPVQFYKLHRYDGQLLYIKATCLGISAVAFSFLIDSYLGVVNWVGNLLPCSKLFMSSETEHFAEYLLFFLFSALISVLWCGLVWLKLLRRSWWLFRGVENKPPYNELAKILLMHTVLKDSPLDQLLFLSYVQNLYLLITMSDRKVYVGRVISLGEPTEKQGFDQEISIVPVFSGYRDKDTLSVNLNHVYPDNDDAKDVYLILKQDNIVSACEFFPALYEKFSEKIESPVIELF